MSHINIEELTIGQAREIASAFSPACKATTNKSFEAGVPNGETWIIIADRGFVWVGKATVRGEYCFITNARNIRMWGTTKGLGELRDGPLTNTKLDDCGEITIPMRAILGFIKCTRDW